MTTNPQALNEFFGYDERDLEFEKIASDLDSHDIEHVLKSSLITTVGTDFHTIRFVRMKNTNT